MSEHGVTLDHFGNDPELPSPTQDAKYSKDYLKQRQALSEQIAAWSKGKTEKAFNPDQARDPNGRFASGSGGSEPAGEKAPTPSTEDQAKSVEGIKSYLGQVAGLYTSMYSQHGMISPQQMVVENGQAYKITDQTYEGKRGEPQLCYMNAGRKALDGDGTYVEGYVSVHGLPIAHAWLDDGQGNVIDPTLTSAKGIGGYFGVPFKTDYLRSFLLSTKVWGVFGGGGRTKSLEQLLSGQAKDWKA